MKPYLLFIVAMILTVVMSVMPQQLPVNLGSAGSFSILSKTGISTTGTTKIVGDIGVSPVTHTAITGFALSLDPTGVFATSTIVTGRVYASDYAVPTPANLTTAVNDMVTAYADAAGRTPVPSGSFLNPNGGNIGGLTLAPGLYKFTSGALITGTDVTLQGSANDVWIFQIASTLTVGNGMKVILAGGAQSSHVFWQVGSSATIGTTCNFNGSILSKLSIALNTGATVQGKLLAQTAVTLAANSIATGVQKITSGVVPEAYSLAQNYPNPFNPSTTINYSIPVSGRVALHIFNILGQEIETLVDNSQDAGVYQVKFDASKFSSGVYIYRLETGSFVSTKKLIVTK